MTDIRYREQYPTQIGEKCGLSSLLYKTFEELRVLRLISQSR